MSWGGHGREKGRLEGLTILVVDDEPLIALDLERIVSDSGGTVLGPAGTLEQAMGLAANADLDVAILDVRLGGALITPVADALAARGTPFLLYSGQVESDPRLTQWAASAFLAKPAPERAIVAVLRRLAVIGGPQRRAPGDGDHARPAP